jgi:uncharacterized Zn-binding protein involved in type VI secretion
MGSPAARLGDPTVHGGAIAEGCATVIIGNQPAARIGDMHACPLLTGTVPHVGGPLVLGSFSVMVGNMPQSRVGDIAVCVGPPDAVAMGCPTVVVGTAGGAAGFSGLLMGLSLGLLLPLEKKTGQAVDAVKAFRDAEIDTAKAARDAALAKVHGLMNTALKIADAEIDTANAARDAMAQKVESRAETVSHDVKAAREKAAKAIDDVLPK